MSAAAPRPSLRLAHCCAVLALLSSACEDLDEFRTGDDAVFHGQVLGSDSEADGNSFIREGFESHTEMEITFDPALAAGSAASADSPEAAPTAGTIHTYQCPPDTDFCDQADRIQGRFDHAELEPIGRLNHDALSQYDFPGAGRIRNYILGARFSSGSDAEAVARHAMVFVSLMENGTLEVRVIAPSVRDADGEDAHPALFGVFNLERRRL